MKHKRIAFFIKHLEKKFPLVDLDFELVYLYFIITVSTFIMHCCFANANSILVKSQFIEFGNASMMKAKAGKIVVS